MKILILIALTLMIGFAHADSASMSDEEITQVIIYKSIATHRGDCACPYSRTNNGVSVPDAVLIRDLVGINHCVIQLMSR